MLKNLISPLSFLMCVSLFVTHDHLFADNGILHGGVTGHYEFTISKGNVKCDGEKTKIKGKGHFDVTKKSIKGETKDGTITINLKFKKRLDPDKSPQKFTAKGKIVNTETEQTFKATVKGKFFEGDHEAVKAEITGKHKGSGCKLNVKLKGEKEDEE